MRWAGAEGAWRQVDIVVLHSCPDDDRSMAIETVGIKFSLLKDNVRVGVARSN